MTTEEGRIFREAWIAGMKRHYPGEPKPGYVALCWIAQIYKHFEDPKPGYVADWQDLPARQQQTDADIFDAIASAVAAAK